MSNWHRHGLPKALGAALLLPAVLIVQGCGGDPPAAAVPKPPCISSDLALQPDEGSQSFSKSTLKSHDGMIRLTVTVPGNAKHQHGVAIDGGVYKNTAGAAVKPGKATSLTVSVKPGTYTIYDPAGDNRAKGYATKLTVTKASKGNAPCPTK